jgi:hypothetical protein
MKSSSLAIASLWCSLGHALLPPIAAVTQSPALSEAALRTVEVAAAAVVTAAPEIPHHLELFKRDQTSTWLFAASNVCGFISGTSSMFPLSLEDLVLKICLC